jgi:carbon-monoxide dehydrogenase large subunit
MTSPSKRGRIEDERLLRGAATYVADLPHADALYLVFVRSTVAHARITGIDADDALDAPGVVAVFTGRSCDLPPILPEPAMIEQRMVRQHLATDTVRFVGEAVAVVVAESEAAATDAAELVVVDYEALPAVIDMEDAEGDTVLVHPEAGTNTALVVGPPADIDFDDCDVVVRQRIVNQRVAIAPMEGRSVLAAWDGDDVTFWISGQGPHPYRDRLAPPLEVDKEHVRVIHPDVGGAFGAKAYPYPEEVVVAWVARRLGRAARWTENRTEALLSQGHGRAQVQYVELGGLRDGTMLAYRIRVVQDCGAYPRLSAYLPNMTRMVMTGPYRITRASFQGTSVVTNTNPLVAYRGAGAPEGVAALERAVDMFAAEIGMDPAEVRRQNLITADAFPYQAPSGAVYDSGDYGKGLDTVLNALGYEGMRDEQRARRASGDGQKVLGIGLCTFVESTSSSNHHEWARVEVMADGSVMVWTGTSPHGQSHATTWAMFVEDELGISMDRVDVRHGDSDMFPSGTVTGGSRSLQVGGLAVKKAAVEVREKAAQLAARMLEADPADIVFDRAAGRFHVAGTPALAVSLVEAATEATNDGGCLDAVVRFDPRGATFPSGAYAAVVEVDTGTGGVELVRFVAVDDAGPVINEQAFHGQVHGGAAQGIAQALHEEIVYDAEGNLLTSTLAEYAMPSAAEFPSFETFAVETPSPLNELGVKGVGESGPSGAMPAVHNAVVDAVAHLGVRHIDMPLTGERVWRAIEEARGRSGNDVTRATVAPSSNVGP